MRVAAQNREKLIKRPLLGGSRSFKVINVDNLKSLSPVLVMISSMSVSICSRFHTMRANNGKITSF